MNKIFTEKVRGPHDDDVDDYYTIALNNYKFETIEMSKFKQFLKFVWEKNDKLKMNNYK